MATPEVRVEFVPRMTQKAFVNGQQVTHACYFSMDEVSELRKILQAHENQKHKNRENYYKKTGLVRVGEFYSKPIVLRVAELETPQALQYALAPVFPPSTLQQTPVEPAGSQPSSHPTYANLHIPGYAQNP